MATTSSPKKLTPSFIKPKEIKKETLSYRIHTRKMDMQLSTRLQVNVTEWLKVISSPCAWLSYQSKNYQLHAKLTQIEGIIKTHLAKVNFDREDLEMDI